jgi:hypothetical protein
LNYHKDGGKTTLTPCTIWSKACTIIAFAKKKAAAGKEKKYIKI